MTRVQLIIPTFNGCDLLIECLRSLNHSTFTDYNLIIVDDGSSEPVRPRVQAIKPDATVIRFEKNRGLTQVFNAAIDAGSAEYVVLLNDDTEVEPDWLAELVACADRHPDAGSIASKLRLAADRGKIHSAGDTYSVRGMPGNRGVWLDDVGQYDEESEIFSACGGAVLYRRSALERVRLSNGDIFDTRLFMYCEDVDLGWRLQLAGFPCFFAPDAVVYHHLSATGGGALASYYVNRNVWLVLARSVPRSFLRSYWPRIAAYHAGRLCRSVRALREPAARRALSGSVAGMYRFIRAYREAPAPDASDTQRVYELLERH